MSEPTADPGAAPAQDPDGGRRPWWRALISAAPDVVALLVVQGELSVAGMDAFSTWSHRGGQDMAEAVRSAQHQAYHARRELLAALQAALSTPVDQEDLYVLSERIDRVLTEARDTLREAEVLGYAPDSYTGKMSDRLAAGTRELVTGFGLLRNDPEEAGRRADAASDAVHHVGRDYREAMAALLEADDTRAIVAGQVLYRRYLDVANAIVAVADRLWFVVLRGA
jgi:uncharacterized protein Yka (UPF0111/DUF47 family)